MKPSKIFELNINRKPKIKSKPFGTIFNPDNYASSPSSAWRMKPKKKVTSKLPSFYQPVKLSQYPVRTKSENKLIRQNPFGDKDRDRVPNYFDCKPLNRKKQGFEHQYSFSSIASKRIKTVKMPPELFLKTTYGESARKYGKHKSEREKDLGGYNRYKDNLYRGADGIIHKADKWRKIDGKLTKLPGKTKEAGMRIAIESEKNHLPIPFLQFNEKGKPVAHEGRHTALVAQRMGLKYIPVTVEIPKEIKLTSKYEILEEIKDKQYKDWEYDKEKREMKESPIIYVESLREEPETKRGLFSDKRAVIIGSIGSIPKKIKEQVKREDIETHKKESTPPIIAKTYGDEDWIKTVDEVYAEDKKKRGLFYDKRAVIIGSIPNITNKIPKKEKEKKEIIGKKESTAQRLREESIDIDIDDIDVVEDVSDQSPSQDIVEDSIESTTADTTYEGSAQDLIDEVDKE